MDNPKSLLQFYVSHRLSDICPKMAYWAVMTQQWLCSGSEPLHSHRFTLTRRYFTSTLVVRPPCLRM